MTIHPIAPHAEPSRRIHSGAGLSSRAWEQTNRMAQLTILGLTGVFVGLLTLFNGTAVQFEGSGEWPRVVVGVLALAGGLLLVTGLSCRPNVVSLELSGLAVLALWTLGMTVGSAATAAVASNLPITWPWVMIHQVQSARLFPIAVYLGLFLMTSVHLVTVHRIRALERRRPVAPTLRVLTAVPERELYLL